jgi:type II secretory pathway pseudopilin PulG
MHCQRDSSKGVMLIVIIIKIKGEGQVKRIIAMVVALIGVAILVMGIVFEFQSNTGKQSVADEIAPIALADLNAKYDQVKAGYMQYATAEEPKIKTGTPPSAMYDYVSAQRALLGMAKSNIATSKFVMMTGTVDIVLGLGLILAGTALYLKPTE